MTAATVADATTVLITNQGTSGDKIDTIAGLAVTLATDTTATAAALVAIDGATTGFVDATAAITSMTAATVAEAITILVTNQGTSGDKIDTITGLAVTLANTETTISTADLVSMNGGTTGLITAGSLSTVTGTATEIDAFATLETAGTEFASITNYRATISDTGTLDATLAEAINSKNGNGVIDITAAGRITATIAEYLAIVANTNSAYTTGGAVAITVEGVNTTSANYNTVQADTTGAITVTVTQNAGVEVLAITSILDQVTVVAATSNSDTITIAAPSVDTTEVVGDVTANGGNGTTYAIEGVGNGVVDAGNNGTLSAANLSAGTLTDVATSINAAFQFGDANGEGAQTEIFFVESDTAGAYGMYSWTQGSATDTTVDAAELNLIGIVTSDDLIAADVAVV